MTSKLEEVARAINPNAWYDGAPKQAQAILMEMARAAIESMRDVPDHLPPDIRYHAYKSGREMYEAMIDYVLNEKPGGGE